MWLAVAGDVHGHLTLLFRVLRRWQDETGHGLDAILQVGDLGAFPPPFRLDDATRRFAEGDPDELGFADYYAGEADAAEIFGPDAVPARALAAPMWFIKGNHEDFEFLAVPPGRSTRSTRTPDRPRCRRCCVSSGRPTTLAGITTSPAPSSSPRRAPAATSSTP
jgi:hypothetical protein